MGASEVSIVVLVHNGLEHFQHLLETLPLTEDVEYELVVVDNASDVRTRDFLVESFADGIIDRLCLLQENRLFAEGNNIGASMCSRDSKYVLLLNSDVIVRDGRWLRALLEVHRPGATAYGYVEAPWPRADGYCILFELDTYLQYGLPEEHEWWWAMTRLEADLLRDGFTVRAVKNHSEVIHHVGGGSGDGYRGARGMDVSPDEVRGWFSGRRVEVIDSLAVGSEPSP